VSRPTELGAVCGHGHLARSCGYCDYEEDIAELRAKLAKAEADRSEVLRTADRLSNAVSEQQHTLGSRGWKSDNDLRWSAAGARWHQYQEVQAALTDLRDVLESKHPSELERRGPYADVVDRLAAAEARIGRLLRLYGTMRKPLWQNDERRSNYERFRKDCLDHNDLTDTPPTAEGASDGA
jgi:hypothetical protein